MEKRWINGTWWGGGSKNTGGVGSLSTKKCGSLARGGKRSACERSDPLIDAMQKKGQVLD